MKKLIQLKLKILAKAILKKYKPEIIGVTGSVGKTSAREAIFAVVSSKFKARQSIKNYNNEIGLPLTIIGLEHPGKSIFGWIAVFFKALALITVKDKNYPEILVLEMGVDRPGDMGYLLGIVKPKVGIITRIGESHLEFFKSIEELKAEKISLVNNLPGDGCAILNFNDDRIKESARLLKVKIISYGFGESASVRAEEIKIDTQTEFSADNINLIGINFKLCQGGKCVNVFLPGFLGETFVEAALAAACAGIAYKLSLDEISDALKKLKNPPGRMKLIQGIKNTLIIDDTYNSSPQSSLAALKALRKINLISGAKKFAILGDMLELGNYTEEGHKLVGRDVYNSAVDELIAVGERARDIGRGAEAAGMNKEAIYYFANSDSAKSFVQERIKESDIILIKGSQGARMEKIVKEIMADPLRADKLLVRQGDEWDS